MATSLPSAGRRSSLNLKPESFSTAAMVSSTVGCGPALPPSSLPSPRKVAAKDSGLTEAAPTAEL